MTDKQIIIDGVDVSGCGQIIDDYQQANRITGKYEHFYNICECGCRSVEFYNLYCQDNPNCYYKQHKRKEKSEEKLVKQIQTICDFINNRPETFKGVNGSVDKIITDYVERKEQECERLNNDNHTLLVTRQKLLNDLWIAEESLKDFKEICDKQCEQLEAYKMEAEEGKEINAELKAELEQEKALKETYLTCYKAKHEDIEGALFKLKQTLTGIKEIAEEKANVNDWLALEILQKISECEVEDV